MWVSVCGGEFLCVCDVGCVCETVGECVCVMWVV